MIETHANGASAPTNIYVYTANYLANFQRFAPLLIDRLGLPRAGNHNRLIVPLPLNEWAEDRTETPNQDDKAVKGDGLYQGGNRADRH
jgi:hypothetical protein